MGAPKAALNVDGQRLIDRAVTVLAAGGCAQVLAVVRSGLAVPGAQIIVNPLPDRGMRSSLALAVDAADALGADALAVVLVDMPGIPAAAVAAILARWTPGRIAIASYDTRRSHPSVMSPELWRTALTLARPDEGARNFLARNPNLVDEVAVDGDPRDLDTPADLNNWSG